MTSNITPAAARRAAAIAANAERAQMRAARRAAERALIVERAALDVLAALAAERAGKSERRSADAIHALNRAAARRTAAQDNGRAAARERAAAADRHALIVTPQGGRRIDVPAARVFDSSRPVAEQGATFAALLPRVIRAAVALAVAEGVPVKGDPAAMLDGLTAQQAAARVARLERAAAMAAHPAGKGR